MNMPQTCLAKIVDGCPNKVTNDVRVLIYEIPVLCHLLGIRFGTIDDAVGEGVVVSLVEFPCIVVATNLDVLEGTRRVGFPLETRPVPKLVDGHGGGTGVILLVGCKVEGESYLLAARHVGALCNLVTDAPHDDGGVVTVTAHHEGHVLLVVTSEVLAVIVAALGFFPLVEDLIDDKHANAVASMEESFSRQVVTAANGVIALCLHQLHLADVSTVYAGSTEHSVVMVNATTTEFHGLTIELEALSSRETDGADAEGDEQSIRLLARLENRHFRLVQMRILDRPKLRCLHGKFGGHIHALQGRCRHFKGQFALCHSIALFIHNLHMQLCSTWAVFFVEHFSKDFHIGILALIDKFGTIHVGVPLVEMQFRSCLHPHMTEDAAASIPTGVQSSIHSLDNHSDHAFVVCMAMGIVRQNLVEVDNKGHVTIDVGGGLHTIHPHLGLVIDAVEADIYVGLREESLD